MSSASKLLIESHYFPSIEYFYFLTKFDSIYLEAYENFQKQSYRNRCAILGANKVDILSVPIKKTGQKVLITEVEIDYSQNWVGLHWKALESAYRNSPYFEYYSPYIEEVLNKEPKFLFELTVELMTLCLKLLRMEKQISYTSGWKLTYEGDFLDLRSKIQPNSDENTFIEQWKPYRQVFGNNFVKNLSVLDLLFNEGPDSVRVLGDMKSY